MENVVFKKEVLKHVLNASLMQNVFEFVNVMICLEGKKHDKKFSKKLQG